MGIIFPTQVFMHSYEISPHITQMYFWHLPISPKTHEGFQLTEKISFSKDTQNQIQRIIDEDPAIASAVYPQYGIPGLGCHHRNLIYNMSVTDSQTAVSELWLYLGILRLIKPLFMLITGSIELQNNEIKQFSTIWTKTFLNIPHEDYKNEDLEHAQRIIYVHKEIKKADSRILQAFKTFVRTTLTEQIMFSQTFFQKLFPILDLLSGNPSWKHETYVKTNIGGWLQWVYSTEATKHSINFESVVSKLWENYRHHFLHLSCSVAPPSHNYVKNNDGRFKNDPENIEENENDAVFALHEIVRLCLLSLIFLPHEKRTMFENLPKIEMRLPTGERENEKERVSATVDFYKSLKEEKIIPNEKFWLEDFHSELFKKFS